MSAEKLSETKPDFVLSESDMKIALATARVNKIKKLEWMSKNNPSLGRDFDDVQLTEDEAAEAIGQANKIESARKFFNGLALENRARQKAEKEELISTWTAQHFFKEMRRKVNDCGQSFIHHGDYGLLVKAICYRLSYDSRYTTELGFSFSKGLLIRGTVGLGKSFVPSLVADNPVCSIQMLSLNAITEEVRKMGEFIGIKFGTYHIIYLDDLGTEETPVKYFGTEIHWFKTWYEHFYATAKNHTHRLMISTNLSFQEIEDKYGFRIRDRMAETFDVLDISGQSLRRK